MSRFIEAFTRWRHPEPPAPPDHTTVSLALSGVRAEVDTVLRETKALDERLTAAELTLAQIALQSRGWIPPEVPK